MANVLNRTTKEYLTSVNTPDYPPEMWVINPNVEDLLARGVPTRYWKINPDDTVEEMSPTEKEAVDNDPVQLEKLKAERRLQIDLKTQELIAKGFVYAGKTFSLSANAQIYWSNLLNVPADQYPLTVNTLDDLSTYEIASAEEARAVYAAALMTVKTRLGSGTALKNRIRAATTKAEVDAVVDDRT
jgi:hypothetical protein